jgi:hypothetical protein
MARAQLDDVVAPGLGRQLAHPGLRRGDRRRELLLDRRLRAASSTPSGVCALNFVPRVVL